MNPTQVIQHVPKRGTREYDQYKIINELDPGCAECGCCHIYFHKDKMSKKVLPWTGETVLCCQMSSFSKTASIKNCSSSSSIQLPGLKKETFSKIAPPIVGKFTGSHPKSTFKDRLKNVTKNVVNKFMVNKK